jgi:hypothetical protein
MKFNVYDNVATMGSIPPQSFTGSTAVNGYPFDTLDYDNAVVYGYAAAASGSPTAATLVFTVQESLTGNSGWTNALDNTGTVIGFTLNALLAPTVNTTSGTAVLSNPSSLTGIYVGQYVTGTGIPAGSTIIAINNTGTLSTSTITISANATSSNTAETLTLSAENYARIEGLGLNRHRFLRVVVTPAFTGGTSPAILGFGALIIGNAGERPIVTPTNAAVSNT